MYAADGETLAFYVGLKLDGHKVYQYNDVTLEGFAPIRVFLSPPTIEILASTIMFNPKKDKGITIQVSLISFNFGYLTKSVTKIFPSI